MKTKQHEIVELEAELLRLNRLVRDRRRELVRLAKCPNETCACRLFWQDHVEKLVARQMRKIRQKIRPDSRTSMKSRKPAATRSRKSK
jgi:hypothetical protein